MGAGLVTQLHPRVPWPQSFGDSISRGAGRDGLICCTFAGMSVSFKAELP